jgi:heme A synthase
MDLRRKKRRNQVIFLATIAAILVMLALMTGFLNLMKGVLLLLIPLGFILLGK